MALDSDFWIDLLKGESPIRVWDKLTLGGITFPGLCKIETGTSLELDVAKFIKKGQSATDPPIYNIRLTDRGYAPGDVRAMIAIWEQDQWEDMKETLPKFSPRTGSDDKGKPNGPSGPVATRAKSQQQQNLAGRDAFDIVHPATALLGISSVLVRGVRILPIEEQTLVVVMDMIQYFPTRTDWPRPVHTSGGAQVDGSDSAVPKAGGNIK